jgi:hypothetical protein
MHPTLLTPTEAAALLGVSPRTLRSWHALPVPPPVHRLTARTLRYNCEELLAWSTARPPARKQQEDKP